MRSKKTFSAAMRSAARRLLLLAALLTTSGTTQPQQCTPMQPPQERITEGWVVTPVVGQEILGPKSLEAMSSPKRKFKVADLDEECYFTCTSGRYSGTTRYTCEGIWQQVTSISDTPVLPEHIIPVCEPDLVGAGCMDTNNDIPWARIFAAQTQPIPVTQPVPQPAPTEQPTEQPTTAEQPAATAAQPTPAEQPSCPGFCPDGTTLQKCLKDGIESDPLCDGNGQPWCPFGSIDTCQPTEPDVAAQPGIAPDQVQPTAQECPGITCPDRSTAQCVKPGTEVVIRE